MSRRARAIPNPRDARLELSNFVTRLRYPQRHHNEIVTQLAHIWTYYKLEPLVMENPIPTAPSSTSPSASHLLCMKGNLGIVVNNPPPPKEYPIPIRIYILHAFPHVQPLIYVVPYPGACIPPNHLFVAPSGLVNLNSPAIARGIWRPNESSLLQTMQRLKESFGYYPPLIGDRGYIERKEKTGVLMSKTAERLNRDTSLARAEYLSLMEKLAALRMEDNRLTERRREWAADHGGGKGALLAATRDSLLKVRALSHEYGVTTNGDVKGASEGGDVDVEMLLGMTSGNPLRDEAEVLDAAERAAQDALDAAGEAMKGKKISLDEFMQASKSIAADLAKTRGMQQKVGRNMSDAVEAELQAAARRPSASGEVSRGGSGGGGKRARGPTSSLLTSGMFPASYVRRGRRENSTVAAQTEAAVRLDDLKI